MSEVTNEDINKVVEGQTIPSLFLQTLADHPDQVVLRTLVGEEFETLTVSQLADAAASFAAGLASYGVGKGDRVVMMLRNIAEFHIADLATTFLGATPVSIYNSSSADQIEYLAGHCEAKFAILEDKTFFERFNEVRGNLPSIENVAILNSFDGVPDDVMSFQSLLDHDPLDLAEAAAKVETTDLATIIYTSGTTGNPKGVMLSHYNVVWTIESLRLALNFEDPTGKRVISYLPMAHIAERAVSHYGALAYAYEITCCPEVSRLSEFLGLVKPNVMFGVPRVWEKIYAGINAALAADPEKKQKVDEAVEAAIPLREKETWGTASEEDLATLQFLDDVAFGTIRALVGLDEVELAITGAAPMTADMLRWFRAVGVPMSEVYGMSENTGAMTLSAYKPKPGSVGPAVPGVTVAIADDGEVICKGGLVFQGYLNDPEKTADALDDDGWLHSGDIGTLDEDGYLTIVDRKKELIITAGGKNISPANLEASLKMIPLVGQACAIGDQKPFVSALVVLDAEVAPVWAENNGLGGKSLAELAQEPAVIEEINNGLLEVMSGFNNAERVKKVAILPDEWMPDSELMTPTSKLKRRGIHTTFADEIESLYN